jgi:two-component system NarL family response regulator
MRVLLADDHALLLEGLKNLLEAHGLEVVGLARNGREAAARARELRPDVILMDVRMPELDGLAATRVIKTEMPDIKIIILTTSTEEQDLFEAVKAGAGGYLLKSMDGESLIDALQDVEEGIPPFAPGLAAKLLQEFAREDRAAAPAPAPAASPARLPGSTSGAVSTAATAPKPAPDEIAEPLTARQREVLTLVAEGMPYKLEGARLSLSPRTVKYHMAEIMRKVHLQNRAQLLAQAGRLTAPGDIDPAASH